MMAADLLFTAMRALRANPLRSALTTLGVVIGVASVVAMVAMGRGAQLRIEKSIGSLGSNLILVMPGAARAGAVMMAAGTRSSLTTFDAAAIRNEITGQVGVAPSQTASGQIVATGANWSTEIQGVTPEFRMVRDMAVSRGRFIEEPDLRQTRKVVVLGQTVAERLFANMDPLGQRVRISGGLYQVIGVLSPKGQAGLGENQDDVVLAPLTTVKTHLIGRQGDTRSVSQISIKAAHRDRLAQVKREVAQLLRQRHRLRAAEDDFSVQDMNAIAQAAKASSQAFTGLLATIAAVSLLVGGIGIMNIMLVSVSERTREIGLRKALGARRMDVLLQFGFEAVALSLAGGLAGLLSGVLIACLMARATALPLVLQSDIAFVAVGFSTLVGIGFGAYPAWRAAHLDPIDALRRE